MEMRLLLGTDTTAAAATFIWEFSLEPENDGKLFECNSDICESIEHTLNDSQSTRICGITFSTQLNATNEMWAKCANMENRFVPYKWIPNPTLCVSCSIAVSCDNLLFFISHNTYTTHPPTLRQTHTQSNIIKKFERHRKGIGESEFY